MSFLAGLFLGIIVGFVLAALAQSEIEKRQRLGKQEEK